MCPIKFFSLYICLKLFASKVPRRRMAFNVTWSAQKRDHYTGSLFCLSISCSSIITATWNSIRKRLFDEVDDLEFLCVFHLLLACQLRQNTSVSTYRFVRNNSGGKLKTRSLLASLATSGVLITVGCESRSWWDGGQGWRWSLRSGIAANLTPALFQPANRYFRIITLHADSKRISLGSCKQIINSSDDCNRKWLRLAANRSKTKSSNESVLFMTFKLRDTTCLWVFFFALNCNLFVLDLNDVERLHKVAGFDAALICLH
jgi:hypothetical protein